jgi:hypothetical protein
VVRCLIPVLVPPQVRSAFNYSSFAYELYKDKTKATPIISSNTKTLKTAGLGHGDLVYLSPVGGAVLSSEMEVDSQPSTSRAPQKPPSATSLTALPKGEHETDETHPHSPPPFLSSSCDRGRGRRSAPGSGVPDPAPT